MALFFCFDAKHNDDEAKWVHSGGFCVIINGHGPCFCSYITRKSSCLFCRAMIMMNACKLWSSWLRCLVRKIQSSLHRTNLFGSATLGGTAHTHHTSNYLLLSLHKLINISTARRSWTILTIYVSLGLMTSTSLFDWNVWSLPAIAWWTIQTWQKILLVQTVPVLTFTTLLFHEWALKSTRNRNGTPLIHIYIKI